VKPQTWKADGLFLRERDGERRELRVEVDGFLRAVTLHGSLLRGESDLAFDWTRVALFGVEGHVLSAAVAALKGDMPLDVLADYLEDRADALLPLATFPGAVQAHWQKTLGWLRGMEELARAEGKG